MRFVDYRCPDCDARINDMYFPKPEDVKNRIKCRCGGNMQRQFGAQILVDNWSPMTNDAQRDIEHFEKKKISGGKYKGREYQNDQTAEIFKAG